MINGIHHTAISVKELGRSVAFYRDVLGFRVRTGAGWDIGTPEADRVVGLADSAARFVMLWTGNSHIELFEYSSPVPKERPADARACDHGYTHVCLDVTDVDVEYQRLTEAGMEFNGVPQSIMGVRTMYGKDPDGNVIEFQEVINWPALAMPAELFDVPKDRLSVDEWSIAESAATPARTK